MQNISDLFISVLPVFAPFFLYAETHFRFFRFFPSFIYRPEPEVVFDCPRRLAHGCDLPVFLLLNDLDRFPAQVKEVVIAITSPDSEPFQITFDKPEEFLLKQPFDFQSKAYLFHIDRSRISSKQITINAKASIFIDKISIIVLNDNLIGTSKSGFACTIADEELPGNSFCKYGDIHIHSQFSQSHVEFGPPLRAIDSMAHAAGLDFCCITDHSYDLMCGMNNYLNWDASGERWKVFIDDISCNSFKTCMIPGEEVSCLNGKNKVVHLLGIGLIRALPGSLDGARKGRYHQPQLTVDQASKAVHTQQGVLFAAHPGSKSGILESLLLSRGKWNENDISKEIDGMQCVNGVLSSTWKTAKRMWIKKLQKGYKLTLAAGNDCHGDFNRYRYLHKPFVIVEESLDHYFGATRTGVYKEKCTNSSIIKALSDGQTFVTSGPFLDICLKNTLESLVKKEDTRISILTEAIVKVESSEEFGKVVCIKVHAWQQGDLEETILIAKAGNGSFFCDYPLEISSLTRSGYLRAETRCCLADGTVTEAFTSPVYFKP